MRGAVAVKAEEIVRPGKQTMAVRRYDALCFSIIFNYFLNDGPAAVEFDARQPPVFNLASRCIVGAVAVSPLCHPLFFYCTPIFQFRQHFSRYILLN